MSDNGWTKDLAVVLIVAALGAIIFGFFLGLAAPIMFHSQNVPLQTTEHIQNMTSVNGGYCAWDGIIIPANSTTIFNLTDGRTIVVNCYADYGRPFS